MKLLFKKKLNQKETLDKIAYQKYFDNIFKKDNFELIKKNLSLGV